MTAQILDGKMLSETMKAELAPEVEKFVAQTGVRPGLATVLVGENHPGRAYVKNKIKACEVVGITSIRHELPSSTTTIGLRDLLGELNSDAAVHGILVQLPLPKHLDEDIIVEAVDPLKDVDGFGPTSLGLLA